MKTLLNNKITLSIVALFIAGMFVYNLLAVPETATLVIDPTASNMGTDIGADLLELRNELELVTLDRNLFSDQKFIELSDFSTDIPDQPTGRPNPFNVIGRN